MFERVHPSLGIVLSVGRLDDFLARYQGIPRTKVVFGRRNLVPSFTETFEMVHGFSGRVPQELASETEPPVPPRRVDIVAKSLAVDLDETATKVTAAGPAQRRVYGASYI